MLPVPIYEEEEHHEGERGDFWGPGHSRHTGGLCREKVGGEVGRQACCAQGRVLLCVLMPLGSLEELGEPGRGVSSVQRQPVHAPALPVPPATPARPRCGRVSCPHGHQPVRRKGHSGGLSVASCVGRPPASAGPRRCRVGHHCCGAGWPRRLGTSCSFPQSPKQSSITYRRCPVRKVCL